MAAKKLIDELDNSVLRAANAEEQITELAMAYDINSPYTSFLAVDESQLVTDSNGNVQRPEQRDVPMQLAKGWHGGPGARPNFEGMVLQRGYNIQNESTFHLVLRLRGGGEIPPNILIRTESEKKMLALVGLQKADGCFVAGKALTDAVGVEQKVVEDGGGIDHQELAWATAVALKYMELKLDDLKESWELIYNKGMAALKKMLSDSEENVKKILEEAEAFIEKN